MFQVKIKNKTGRDSLLNIVDLAGSERTTTQAGSKRTKTDEEGIHIN